jgi:rubrerythrin
MSILQHAIINKGGIMFNILEVFEIAEQIERNGYNFYMKAASISSEPSAKEFLENLAEMENDHERLFANMRNKYCEKDTDLSMDLDDTAVNYINAFVNGEVFLNLKPLNEVIMGRETLEEIKKLAIEFEKNTVVYFTTLKNALKDSADKDKVEELINEELRHISILVDWKI